MASQEDWKVFAMMLVADSEVLGRIFELSFSNRIRSNGEQFSGGFLC